MKTSFFLLALFIAIPFFACKKNKSGKTQFNSKTEKELIEYLKQSYRIDMFDVSPTNEQQSKLLNSLKTFSTIYDRIDENLDLDKVRLFVNQNENISIAIFRFENDLNKFFAVSGSFSQNRFIINNECFYGREMHTPKNGRIILTNNNEAIEIKFDNGIHTINNLNINTAIANIIQASDCHGNHGGIGFCQREPGESFNTCYSAELNEFCNSFISCIALSTNPQVSILIALACTCSATQCPAQSQL